MREVGAIGRTALRAVRTVVSADHAPTVAQESRGAQEVLAAAGIAYSQDGARVPVPPHRAAVLAGAVRDRAADVITHSRAQCCTVRVIRDEGCIGVEVLDGGDGCGTPARPCAAHRSAAGCGFDSFDAAARFCMAHDERRAYLRCRHHLNEAVSLAEQRRLVHERWGAGCAVLQAM